LDLDGRWHQLQATTHQLQAAGYWQQSPGQHDDPLWQQLAPQQLPGQHFAPGLQHAAPVRASADKENSDVAINARTFAFMENSSQCEKLQSSAHRPDTPGSPRKTERHTGLKSADRL
jgi:hypothetical protein